MAAADLSRVLHALISDRGRALRFRDGDDSAADLDALDAAERGAVADRDLARLYALGAHPLLVFHLSAILHQRAHYVANVVPAIQGVTNPYHDYYALRPPPGDADG